MCGLAGVLDPTDRGPRLASLSAMATSLAHRGPDEMGVLIDGPVGLAHTRLSIIDLATGQQPMRTADGHLAVAWNGEIFNYVELREELRARGRRFRTPSDTEVVLQAFDEWGDDAFTRFNGQFAVALWDRRRRSLTLARDPFGVRPLFVCEHGGAVYFGSEVKAIFAANPEIPRAIDPTGLAETFTFWSVVPPQSIFAGVEELRPGWVRRYQAGERLERVDRAHFEHRFPLHRDEEFRGSLDEATEALSAALRKATALRMLRSDVPVGSYLSGGLDSSVVAALGRQAKGEGFRTFSLRFTDDEYDEGRWQREMSERLGGDHAEVVVSRADIAKVFPDVIWHTERPVLRSAPAPLFLLSKLVRDSGIKVVLTGEGADEVLAGYDLFREAKVRRFWARRPHSTIRPRLLERLYPYLSRSPTAQRAMARQFFGQGLDRPHAPDFAHGPRWRAAAALQRLFSTEVRGHLGGFDPPARLLGDLPGAFAGWGPLARDQYLEIRTLLAGYILSSQGDRMMMAHSVEGRFPFLDREVAALAASFPADYKLRVLDEKNVLKRAARDLVPPSILSRKKQPYRAPDALSFVDAEWARELLTPEALASAGLFEPRSTSALWAKVQARRDEAQMSNADNMALVGVLSAQLLHQRFVREAPVRAADIRFTTRIVPDQEVA